MVAEGGSHLGGVAFVDGGLRRPVSIAVFVADVVVRALRPDRVARQHDPFEHLVRIALHQYAVVVRAWLRFIGVDAEVNRPRVILREERPFQPCREAGTAATTQAGVFHLRGDFEWLLIFEDLLEDGVAAVGAVAFQLPAVGLIHTGEEYGFECHETVPCLSSDY